MQIRPVDAITCARAELPLDVHLRLTVIYLVGLRSRKKRRRIELDKICTRAFTEAWHVNIKRHDDYVREQGQYGRINEDTFRR